MAKLINLIGKKFGRLVVIKRMDNNKQRQSMWLCVCDCGNEKIILGYNLKNSNTKSCGCLQIEKVTKHGYSTSKTYNSWRHMIQRCADLNHKFYHNYGGRGITVCKKWLKFENFLEDMGEPPSAKHSIDRINNNGNYCKSNCRWATRKEQVSDMRNNLYFTYKNKTQLLIEWSEETGIPYSTLWQRIYRLGWSIEKALTTPAKKGDRYE